MDITGRNLIFSLRGINKRARKVISHRYNRKATSKAVFHGEKCLVFGNFSVTKDPNPILTLADRSPGWTRVYEDAQSTTNEMLGNGKGPRRVAVTAGYHTILSLGRDEKGPARFEFFWNLNPEQTRWWIKQRISGLAEDVRGNFLIDFPGQTPFREPDRISHLPIAELGAGGYGKVWKTIDALSGDFMAVKMIHPPEDWDRGERAWKIAMFMAREREVYYLERLDHPHIIQIFGSQGWDAGVCQIFFPLKKGSLEDLIMGKTGIKLSESQMMGVGHRALIQMLTALEYIALEGVVHRDIKPDNILYDIDHRGRAQFVLSDFGLANGIESAISPAGTDVYAAPEMLNGSELEAAYKADIWSLFITMLWVYDIYSFRDILHSGDFKNRFMVHQLAVKASYFSPEVKYIREMGIYDPRYRAYASQILHNIGRKDLIRAEYRPLRPGHYDRWMKHVYKGSVPFRKEVRKYLEAEGLEVTTMDVD
ncbi:kinase-like protein [Hypoxylon sp. EC38]|nr:kinase-like protein [Hypoxylon sp. EC38]